MRASMIKLEFRKIKMYEKIANHMEIIKRILVPKRLRKIIFWTFHANPLGAHFSLYYTLHWIRIRYHWPKMYEDIKKWIWVCAACILKNSNAKPATELLYTFPMTEPLSTIHVDAWIPGKFVSYNGSKGLMVSVCHMARFASMEAYNEANAKEFSRSI